jgi:hypothetical protein
MVAATSRPAKMSSDAGPFSWAHRTSPEVSYSGRPRALDAGLVHADSTTTPAPAVRSRRSINQLKIIEEHQRGPQRAICSRDRRPLRTRSPDLAWLADEFVIRVGPQRLLHPGKANVLRRDSLQQMSSTMSDTSALQSLLVNLTASDIALRIV